MPRFLVETGSLTPDRYRQFFRYFPEDTKTVLDVDCNTGRGGRVLKELQPDLQIMGLDCVESRLEQLPSHIYHAKINSYSSNICLNEASVDVIVAGEFIEHLYDEDVLRSLAEFYRILKSQGKLLLTTPNPHYLRLKLTGGTVLGGAHVSQHDPFVLKQQLEKIGFVSIQLIGSGKMSRLIGQRFPLLALYGSYLAIANKP